MAEHPRAILFDLQGTCTDFFSSVVAAALRIDTDRQSGTAESFSRSEADWAAFVSDWRQAYRQALGQASGAAPPWRSVRAVYRQALDSLLAERGWSGFSAAQHAALVLAWEEQRPWPDVVPGLERLRRRAVLGALSNADLPAVVRTAKAGALPFDLLLSAQMFQAFKPNPQVYLGAARWLALDPGEILLVACHAYDVAAARQLGFRAAFIPRPEELGPGAGAEAAPPGAALVRDFAELADQLGC